MGCIIPLFACVIVTIHPHTPPTPTNYLLINTTYACIHIHTTATNKQTTNKQTNKQTTNNAVGLNWPNSQLALAANTTTTTTTPPAVPLMPHILFHANPSKLYSVGGPWLCCVVDQQDNDGCDG